MVEEALLEELDSGRAPVTDGWFRPPGTAHVFVGRGDGPCAIFMTGGRTREKEIVYPHSELARSYRAGAERETSLAIRGLCALPSLAAQAA